MGEVPRITERDEFWTHDAGDERLAEGLEAYDAFTAEGPRDQDPYTVVDSLGPNANAPIHEAFAERFLDSPDSDGPIATS